MKKAEELLKLAFRLAGSRTGLTLDEVQSEFGWQKRTAQRRLGDVEGLFPQDLSSYMDDEGRKRWRLEGQHLRELMNLSAEEMAAITLGESLLKRDGMVEEADALRSLGDKVLTLIPRKQVSRLDVDQEALLQAQGFVARPGPRPRIDGDAVGLIVQAIKACKVVEFEYRSQGGRRATNRRVAPYGLLSGFRRYLVGAPPRGGNASPKTYRLDGIRSIRISDEAFIRPDSFNLQAFANKAFGVFQNDSEFDEVEWRFLPHAALNARGHIFHPEQETIDSADGSLTVKFRAAGLLEMCWYLYAWGDGVEVIRPIKLREMTEKFRRSDFPAMP